ncbi:hypothetical protein GE061_003890 [Apolygus lucorum]|uniref:Odorant receptor n=1 Tax=Apolygus lucorum TaxID=248454 RepID=A0A8S9WZ60_APOLU|nr:hypothetical protein GE061_003890 [Apolygus lucorum]
MLLCWKKKKEKQKPVIKEQHDFANNYRLFKYIGMIQDGSLFSRIRVFLATFLLFYAWFHHLIPLVNSTEEYSFDELMDLIHLEMVYFLWCIVWPSYIIRAPLFTSLASKIQNGLYTYSDPLTLEEKTILSTANDAVVRMTKISVYVYVCGGIGIFLKGMNKERMRKLQLPNIGWFPFAINSLSRYAIGCLCQAIMGINAISIAIGTFMSFAIFLIHYEAQFKLLRTHLKRSFPKNVPLRIAQTNKYKEVSLRRLKDCYLHHLAILGCHQEIMKYYGILLLVFRVAIVMWMCTLAYVTVMVDVNAHNLLKMLSFASTELLYVFLFSFRGQDVTDWNYQWREELYSIQWWEQPKEVKTNIGIMVLGTTQPLLLYGVWKIALYSHEKLSDIGNESFSFFNMLRAIN